MKKLNQYFFGTDHVAVSETLFFYGLSILVITICIFNLIGIATL